MNKATNFILFFATILLAIGTIEMAIAGTASEEKANYVYSLGMVGALLYICGMASFICFGISWACEVQKK